MSSHSLVFLSFALLTVHAELPCQELRRISPPLLFGGCYDPIRERVVIPVNEGYSREWDGSVWRQTPDPGAAVGFTYLDDATGRLVSLREANPYGIGLALLVATRIGHAWQQVPMSGGPTDRWGMALAWDRGRAEVLAFGGMNGSTGTPYGDTWTFDGTAWVQRAPATSPPPLVAPSLAYDSARQCVVLFGGYDVAPHNDTWEWNGTTWAPVAVTAPPPASWYTPIAYNATRARTVMITANASGTAEHWEYDGAAWTQLAPPPFLPVFSLVFDAARSETLAFGSSGASAYHAIVHAWNGTTWTPRGDLGTAPYDGYAFSAATGPTGTTLRRFGGEVYAPPTAVDSLWEFDGANWTRLATGGLPGRAAAAMWSMAGATFVFGGRDSTNTPLGDTWRWNGTAWAQLGSGPSPRYDTAIAVDPVQNVAVQFGGFYALLFADTWIFNGTTWQQVTPPAPLPPARYSHAMAYDVARNRVVLFGGVGAGPLGSVVRRDTWEWNGTSWQRVLTANAPWSTGTMAWDAVRQRVVFVTNNTLTAGYELWQYDGIDWTMLPVAGTAGSPHPLTPFQPIAVTGPNGRVAIVDVTGVAELLPLPARATHYGAACGPGSLLVTAAALPRVPEPTFALDVTGAPATAPVLLAGSTDSATVPLFGCTLLIAPTQATVLLLSSAQGFASQPLPIPAAASLLGEDLYFQAAALGSTGFVLSTGLRVDLGQ